MAVEKKMTNANINTDVATTFTVNEIREAFWAWIADGHAKNYSPEVIVACMERTSEYAVRKKIVSDTLWEITNYRVFSEVYNKILANKLFRITEKKTYATFIKVGRLYLQFLKEKAYLKTMVQTQIDSSMGIPKAGVPSIKDILTTHFQNGFRIDSPIELNRFRRFTLEDYGGELVISDEALRDEILMVGTIFDGKVYVVSEKTRENLKKIVFTAFGCGSGLIFYTTFYDKHENWLFNKGIVSADMLKGILKTLCPDFVFARSYFTKEGNITLESELVNCFEHSILLNYEQLAEMLPYIPLDKIKWTLSQNGDFIWNTVETYTHISRFDITEEEKQIIRTFATKQYNQNGYLSLADIPLDNIAEQNFELSVTALHNMIFRICLDVKYERRGKIVTRKGITLDALEIMKKHCRTLEQCTLDDLLAFERELTGESHRWIPMEAAYAVMVRIDATTYVAQKLVNFDVVTIDAALDNFCPEDYIPLRSVTTFAAFPHVGQPWTLFLLESYVRRFSHKFRFEVLSVNSKNCGAIVRKSCEFNYRDIMTDVVARSSVVLNKREVLEFLYTNGYIGKHSWSGIDALLNHAKILRERGR
jgi:hypothetical protein